MPRLSKLIAIGVLAFQTYQTPSQANEADYFQHHQDWITTCWEDPFDAAPTYCTARTLEDPFTKASALLEVGRVSRGEYVIQMYLKVAEPQAQSDVLFRIDKGEIYKLGAVGVKDELAENMLPGGLQLGIDSRAH